MCSDDVFIAGRYNKYLRNLSQSPWIDKDDVRIKESVQELIEDGLRKYLQFGKLVFSSSGREDVDVRMLGRGRPFSFKIVQPFNLNMYNDPSTMANICNYINTQHGTKIWVRDLQLVSKQDVAKNMKEGQESKTKQYRALCCCSRLLSSQDMERIDCLKELDIDQKTPIRVLHRRTISTRRRRIHNIKIKAWLNSDCANDNQFNVSASHFEPEELNRLYVLTLLTEAGTYIKEFVHGDFGRTRPSLASILTDCDTDLIELDVMEVNLDWPPNLEYSVSEQAGISHQQHQHQLNQEIQQCEFNQQTCAVLSEIANAKPTTEVKEDDKACHEHELDNKGKLNAYRPSIGEHLEADDTDDGDRKRLCKQRK